MLNKETLNLWSVQHQRPLLTTPTAVTSWKLVVGLPHIPWKCPSSKLLLNSENGIFGLARYQNKIPITVELLIKDPPRKGALQSTFPIGLILLRREEDNLSTKDNMAGPKVSWLHCSIMWSPKIILSFSGTSLSGLSKYSEHTIIQIFYEPQY